MKRFQRKGSPPLFAAIGLSIAAVFVADYFTKLGIAIWVFYFVPVVLSLQLWRPAMPLIVTAVATLLMVIGYLVSPPGAEAEMARINRGFGLLTLWVLAGIGYQFIHGKLAVAKQEWLQSGQTRLNEKMAGEQNVQEVGDNVLRFICSYVHAQAAAIYTEEGDGFRRVATYAVTAAESAVERFKSGDGLLGQAVKDVRPFLISDVPDGYLTIGSALGKHRPRHLVIAPITVDGRANGVMEFGFFDPVTDSAVELLERVGESVGVAVRSAMYRMRLQELLEETQRQSEEVQAQSEELRVSNEELEERTRALKESQARLENQQAELEQTNTQLEEQAQVLEAQKEDLTRSKLTLERQALVVEQASRYKTNFLANMSHELRTPLNSSLILAKLLADNRDGNLTPEQIKYAQTIQSAGNDLLALINDVLDLSKIEGGHMEVKPEPVSIDHVIVNLRNTFEHVAAQKRLAFRAEIIPGSPASIVTDVQRLEQVLRNLISNALKFTARGEVVVTVARADDGRVAFAVRDSGIGIAPDQHETIFEPFCQADGTTNRKYGGTGLGLSISRELARLLGGEILLTSELDHGSTFTLLLPQTYAPSEKPKTAVGGKRIASALTPKTRRPDSGAGANAPALLPDRDAPPRPDRVPDDRERLSAGSRVILIVEDDESFAGIVGDLARELRFQCLIASSAEEALVLAKQYSPSAVILDIGLPDNSGLFVLERLKADARTRHIPVHVVSGRDYAETALALGAVGYMLKPLQREQLMDALQKLETHFTQKLRRVLLVEDDAVQLESLQHLLASRNVETVGVRTAAECLEQLRTTTFDCMVLDLSLPDASGFSLLETLSSKDTYSFPPVIVYTGRNLEDNEEQELRRYSKSIIIKGAKSPERLLDEVTLFLHQVVSELPAEQQRLLAKARSREEAFEGRRILIVEDDVRNIFALTSLLEPRGAKLQIARNGRESLEALERSAKGEAPPVDLVLMDIMMPEMDGMTAMREIRKRAEWKKLPIIALTAKAMKSDHQKALEAGANDYLPKPIDVEKLLSLIRVWISR